MSDLRGRPTWPTHRRIGLLELDSLTLRQRALYDAIVGGPRKAQHDQVPITDESGRLLGPFGLMLLAPEVGDAVQRLGAALRFDGVMSVRCRELAILATARAIESGFEWWAHERAALAAGIDVGQLQRVLDGEEPIGLDETELTVVRLASLLSRDRGLADADFGEAERVLGRAGLAELIWLVGYYTTLALALDVFAPVGPPADGCS